MGYVGKLQFIFALLGDNGHYATEMDSEQNGNKDSTPRSHPSVSHATFIGGSPDPRKSDPLMHLNDGTGGTFVNMILSHSANGGIKNEDCGSET